MTVGRTLLASARAVGVGSRLDIPHAEGGMWQEALGKGQHEKTPERSGAQAVQMQLFRLHQTNARRFALRRELVVRRDLEKARPRVLYKVNRIGEAMASNDWLSPRAKGNLRIAFHDFSHSGTRFG